MAEVLAIWKTSRVLDGAYISAPDFISQPPIWAMTDPFLSEGEFAHHTLRGGAARC